MNCIKRSLKLVSVPCYRSRDPGAIPGAMTAARQGDLILKLNCLSIKAWRRMREWRYTSSIILYLGNILRWVVSPTAGGRDPRVLNWGWFSSSVGLEAEEKKNTFLPLPGMKHRPSIWQLVAIPTELLRRTIIWTVCLCMPFRSSVRLHYAFSTANEFL
jgi:hypothetical protein